MKAVLCNSTLNWVHGMIRVIDNLEKESKPFLDTGPLTNANGEELQYRLVNKAEHSRPCNTMIQRSSQGSSSHHSSKAK